MSPSNRRVCAIILAAGKGTRMKSDTPKVLHSIGGKPILSRVLETLTEAGVDHQCLVLGGDVDPFNSILDQHPQLTCVIQNNRLGTGDAVASAISAFPNFASPTYTDGQHFRGPTIEASHLLISAGDTPALSGSTIRDFVQISKDEGCKLAVIGMKHPTPHGYGRMILKQGRLDKIVEEKDADEATKKIQLCNTGIIFAETEFLFELLHGITNENAQKEYYLTDCFEKAKDLGEPAFVYETDDYGCFEGVNTRAQLCHIESSILEKHRNRLMEEGVSFQLPQTCYIEDTVKIGRDTMVGPHCTLLGTTTIGEHCVIGAAAVLQDQIIAKHQVIEPGTILRPKKN